MSVALRQTIDPSLPQPNALDMLRQAQGVVAQTTKVIAAAPRVARNTTRRMRMFRRAYHMRGATLAPSLPLGMVSRAPRLQLGAAAPAATRFFTRDVGRMFDTRAGVTTKRSQRMASSMLRAAGQARRAPAQAPGLDILAALRSRSEAMAMIGTLNRRFADASLDLCDGRADMARTRVFEQRFGRLTFAI